MIDQRNPREAYSIVPSDAWQEAPCGPTLEDDFFMLSRCGLPYFAIVHKLADFHDLRPALVWKTLQQLQLVPRAGPVTEPMLPIIIAAGGPPLPVLAGWRNQVWRKLDKFLAHFALLEDQLRHHTRVPPGWQKVG
jgi:hypothetical protein